MAKKLTGLIAAPHTPMRADGSVDLAVIERQVKVLLEGGVTGAFVCGTTGEGPSLSTAERTAVAERWAAAAPPQLPVIVHVGHASVAEARALAAHAEGIGARGVAALAPFFFRPARVQDLVEFCAQVAAGAPDTPFYYYHLPTITNVTLPVAEFLRLARERIPTLAGVKYTHTELMEYQQCLRFGGGELDVLFGRDEMLLGGLATGARGAVGSTYNYAAPLYLRMIQAFDKGDLKAAQDLQHVSVRLVEIIRRYGEIPGAKAIMTMLGADCGPPRAPLPKLAEDQVNALRQDLLALQADHGGRIFNRTLA